MNNLKDITKLLEKFKLVHGNKYFYDKMVYIKSNIKVIITCPIHGDFEQSPNNHRAGSGCSACGKINMKKTKTKTNEQIIKEFIEVHGDTYTYDKVDYKGDKVIIVCSKHGDFEQGPSQHIKGQGCPKCVHEKMTKTNEQIIKEFIEVHGDTYTYDKVDYKGINEHVIITCKVHGDFEQRPTYHKNHKSGCAKCFSLKSHFEIYKDRPTLLYYVKVNNLWKIGICLVDKRFKSFEHNIINGRFREYKNKLNINVLKFKLFKDGYDAYKSEQEILNLFDSDRYIHTNSDMNWFGGHTELFKVDIRLKNKGILGDWKNERDKGIWRKYKKGNH